MLNFTILNFQINNGSIPHHPGFQEIVLRVLTKSQEYMREQKV